MRKNMNDAKQLAGFWIRLCANLLDLFLIVLLVVSAARLGTHLGWYIPIEITVLTVGAVYVIGSEAWTGQTIGKWFCGLTVMGKDGEAPRIGRLILRETAGKLLFLLPLGAVFACGLNRGVALFALLVWLALGAGLVCCIFNRRKRAWYDWIVRTVVIRNTPPLGRWSVRFAAVGVGLALAFALDVPSWISIARDYRTLRSGKSAQFALEQRNPKDLIEAASLDKAQEGACIGWLRTNAVSPMEYAVAKAQQHQVLVFGEFHGKKDYVDLLNELIPQLYKRAGVTTVAMEVCMGEDNPELERLVTSKTFDRELALKLARHAPWGTWGYKEYWDVFETVWRLNQSIPRNQKKMRVIGLDSPMDLQSMAMTMRDANEPLYKYCSWWEMLRVIRFVRIFPKVGARELQMAGQIEREIFNKGEQAIIWIGQAHTHAGPAVFANGNRNNHMGAMLRQRHGDDVYFIWLHGIDAPASAVDPGDHGRKPVMASRIEAMMEQSGLATTGFDASASPLGLLRETAAADYHFEPRLALTDLTDGYVYLKPWSELTPCTWTPDYITPVMFAADKPFYQACGNLAKHPVNNAADANAFFLNFIP